MRDNEPIKVPNVRLLMETDVAIQVGLWYFPILTQQQDEQRDEYDTTRPWIPKALISASSLSKIGDRGFIIIPTWLAQHNSLGMTPPLPEDIDEKYLRPTDELWSSPAESQQ